MWRGFAIIAPLALAGCAALQGGGPAVPPPRPAPAATAPDADTPRPRPRPADDAAPAMLGRTLASLGDPSRPGLWLRTGLVDTARKGTVTLANDDAQVAVELRPADTAPGAGSQMSLAAFRALGVPLTELVAVRVMAR